MLDRSGNLIFISLNEFTKTTLHLYYARFISHFLYSLGMLPTREPFKQLLVQGMVMGQSYSTRDGKYLKADQVTTNAAGTLVDKSSKEPVVTAWEKMSKSKYNGVSPSKMFSQYSTDTIRLLILADVAPTSNRNWSEDTFPGILNWQRKLYQMITEFIAERSFLNPEELEAPPIDDPKFQADEALMFDARNYYVHGVTFNIIGSQQLSIAISKMLGLTNDLKRAAKPCIALGREYERALAAQIIMLAPLAPHFASELWAGFCKAPHRLVNDGEFDWDKDVLQQRWPEVDMEYKLKLNVKMNGKEFLKLRVRRRDLETMDGDDILRIVAEEEKFKRYLEGRKVTRVFYNAKRSAGAEIQITAKKNVTAVSQEKISASSSSFRKESNSIQLNTPASLVMNSAQDNCTQRSRSTPKKCNSHVRVLDFDRPWNRTRSDGNLSNINPESIDTLKQSLPKGSHVSHLFQSPEINNEVIIEQQLEPTTESSSAKVPTDQKEVEEVPAAGNEKTNVDLPINQFQSEFENTIASPDEKSEATDIETSDNGNGKSTESNALENVKLRDNLKRSAESAIDSEEKESVKKFKKHERTPKRPKKSSKTPKKSAKKRSHDEKKSSKYEKDRNNVVEDDQSSQTKSLADKNEKNDKDTRVAISEKDAINDNLTNKNKHDAQLEELMRQLESSPQKVFSVNKTDEELAQINKETPAKEESNHPELDIHETPYVSKPAENTNLHARISELMIVKERENEEKLKPPQEAKGKPKIIKVEQIKPATTMKPPQLPNLLNSFPVDTQLKAQKIKEEQIKHQQQRIVVDKCSEELEQAVESITAVPNSKNETTPEESNAIPPSPSKDLNESTESTKIERLKAVESITRLDRENDPSEHSDDSDSDTNLQLVLDEEEEDENNSKSDGSVSNEKTDDRSRDGKFQAEEEILDMYKKYCPEEPRTDFRKTMKSGPGFDKYGLLPLTAEDALVISTNMSISWGSMRRRDDHCSSSTAENSLVQDIQSLDLSSVKSPRVQQDNHFNYNNSIEILNDDCLLDIMHRLPIKDRMRFLQVSRRWKRLIEDSFRRVTPHELQRFIEDTCHHTNLAVKEIVKIVLLCIRRISRVVVNVHYGKHLQNARVLDVLRE
ncbi:unnamed protein product [Trichogramma brassicae]|uniref:leucine--tRNA ligase n=1 Tax=Trichogramma brassicae TaxID=86971 RepID=A0A6H5HWK7_9HYME|nr:unnamed protein product [Trichogramma brassicae]